MSVLRGQIFTISDSLRFIACAIVVNVTLIASCVILNVGFVITGV